MSLIREGLTRKKKKSVKFHTWGGGSGQNWVIFTLFLFFFFHVLNHANLQRKIFSIRGGDFSPKHISVDVKKKNFQVSHFLGGVGGGVGSGPKL